MGEIVSAIHYSKQVAARSSAKNISRQLTLLQNFPKKVYKICYTIKKQAMKLEANLTEWMWNELLLCGSIVRLGNKRKTKDSISRIIKKIVL